MGNYCSGTSPDCGTFLINQGYAYETCLSPSVTCEFTGTGAELGYECSGNVYSCTNQLGPPGAYCGATEFGGGCTITENQIYSTCDSGNACYFDHSIGGCDNYTCQSPTPQPTNSPTETPTETPTKAPTTASPTDSPSVSPTLSPTAAPTATPTATPTNFPTHANPSAYLKFIGLEPLDAQGDHPTLDPITPVDGNAVDNGCFDACSSDADCDYFEFPSGVTCSFKTFTTQSTHVGVINRGYRPKSSSSVMFKLPRYLDLQGSYGGYNELATEADCVGDVFTMGKLDGWTLGSGTNALRIILRGELSQVDNCKAFCDTELECSGFSYNDGECKMFTSIINTTVPAAGHVCYTKHAFTPEPTQSPGTPAPTKSPTTASPTKSPTTLAPTNAPTYQTKTGGQSCDPDENHLNICGPGLYCRRLSPGSGSGQCVFRLDYGDTCADWYTGDNSACDLFYICRTPSYGSGTRRCVEPGNHFDFCEFDEDCYDGLTCEAGQGPPYKVCIHPSGSDIVAPEPTDRLAPFESCHPNAPWPICDEPGETCTYFSNTGHICYQIPTTAPTNSPSKSPTRDCHSETYGQTCGITQVAFSNAGSNNYALSVDESERDVCWNLCLADANCNGYEFHNDIDTCFFWQTAGGTANGNANVDCYTKFDSCKPTVSPTVAPTGSPSTSPTNSPSTSPTVSPSVSPTLSPTLSPTVNDCYIINADSQCNGIPYSNATGAVGPSSTITSTIDDCNFRCKNDPGCLSYDWTDTNEECHFYSDNSTATAANTGDACFQKINGECNPTATPTESPSFSPTESPSATPTLSPTGSPTVATGGACTNETFCDSWEISGPGGGFCNEELNGGECDIYKNFGEPCVTNSECALWGMCGTTNGQSTKQCRSTIGAGDQCYDDADCVFSAAERKECVRYEVDAYSYKQCWSGDQYDITPGSECFSEFATEVARFCVVGYTCDLTPEGYRCVQTDSPTKSPTTLIPTMSPTNPTPAPTGTPTSPTPRPTGLAGASCVEDADCATNVYCDLNTDTCANMLNPGDTCEGSSSPCRESPEYFCGYQTFSQMDTGAARRCVLVVSQGSGCVEDGNCFSPLRCELADTNIPSSGVCQSTSYPTTSPTVILPFETCDPNDEDRPCIGDSQCLYSSFFREFRCTATSEPTNAPTLSPSVSPTPQPTLNFGTQLLQAGGFGASIDVGTDVMVVGRPNDDAFDVWHKSNNDWVYYTTIDGPEGSGYGSSVSISSDDGWIAVGAPLVTTTCSWYVDNNPNDPNACNNDQSCVAEQCESGAPLFSCFECNFIDNFKVPGEVSIYKRNGANSYDYTHDKTYTVNGGKFGFSVAITNEIVVAGAPEFNQVFFAFPDGSSWGDLGFITYTLESHSISAVGSPLFHPVELVEGAFGHSVDANDGFLIAGAPDIEVASWYKYEGSQVLFQNYIDDTEINAVYGEQPPGVGYSVSTAGGEAAVAAVSGQVYTFACEAEPTPEPTVAPTETPTASPTVEVVQAYDICLLQKNGCALQQNLEKPCEAGTTCTTVPSWEYDTGCGTITYGLFKVCKPTGTPPDGALGSRCGDIFDCDEELDCQVTLEFDNDDNSPNTYINRCRIANYNV